MSKKPYMYEHLEWLEIFKRKDWNDPTVNPDDLAEYSEFGKPYAQPDGEDTYQGWEMTWPDNDFPDIPPIITPDPVENPCNIEDSCTAIGIIGPDEMECGDCYTFTHAHVVLSCEPQWWMAFGSWDFDPLDSECSLLFSPGPIMATVCCPDGKGGSFKLSFSGPLECSDSKEVVVSCDECCEEFSLTGNSTVTAGQVWVGTISPACPCAECTVVSNSGCTLGCVMNGSGSQVAVTVGGGDCGGFTVTIIDKCSGDECEANVDSKFVTINGGDWVFDVSASDLGVAGCIGCGSGGGSQNFGTSCYVGEYWYGGFDPVDTDCSGSFASQCKGPDDCGGDWGINICGWPAGSCTGNWPCRTFGWVRCKYVCEC
jgi:hypothetical protein